MIQTLNQLEVLIDEQIRFCEKNMVSDTPSETMIFYAGQLNAFKTVLSWL